MPNQSDIEQYRGLHPLFDEILDGFNQLNATISRMKMDEERPNDQDRFEYEHQRQQEEDDNVPSN